MSNEGYLREIAELQDRLKATSKKCWGYERDYIAPCFTLAAECGIDLRALANERVGHNCVDILIRELIDQRDAARSKLTKALPDHQVLITFLREAFRRDGAEGDSVHAACDLIERLSADHAIVEAAKRLIATWERDYNFAGPDLMTDEEKVLLEAVRGRG